MRIHIIMESSWGDIKERTFKIPKYMSDFNLKEIAYEMTYRFNP